MYRLDRECKVARVKAVRGSMTQQVEVLLALTPDDLVPQDHPIRRIKPIVEGVPKELSPVFNRMYSQVGRPSIPPEHLLKANLLIALYSIRSEPATGGFCERLQYDLLFKWFLDMNIMDPAPSASLKTCFDPTTFSKNRTRLLDHEVAPRFFQTVVSEARRHRLLSEEHFSVDGTLLEAWASMKSLRPKDDDQEPPAGSGGRNPWRDFRGERRKNATHVSTTDREARLARKGPGHEARLCFSGHILMANPPAAGRWTCSSLRPLAQQGGKRLWRCWSATPPRVVSR